MDACIPYAQVLALRSRSYAPTCNKPHPEKANTCQSHLPILHDEQQNQARTCMSRTTRAASSTERAKQEMQSRVLQAGTTPEVVTRPTVGLTPTHPLNCAGMRPARVNEGVIRGMVQ